MPKPFSKELTLDELAALPDSEIDTDDIPDLDEVFWRNSQIVEPEGTEQITLRVKKSILQAYRSTGKGYQTRMNAALEIYVQTLKK
ncbi:3-oxoacyl-ACP synthase [Xaviernesmea oryzae]|uniref:3-oxoacyl-ACP synthase n=1 Tax=Xaviernesmea oryzae TaxID=464029 RepID=A0A1Q9AYK6_9HYPH|nr:BrnA antitoxin family protein [Xaviernesmea oryzae]OLP60536.1 3-oxoacyl-ACP synthase [Xaviernesmea oryzae]SEM29209.1 BrnA antitoxin of type II toxin-antitoxin system [Xaviernesmea oryzae]